MKKSLLLLIICICFASVSGGEIVIVASKEFPIYTMNKADLKKLFIGKQTTIQNSFIHPTIQKSKPIHKRFLKTFLKMNARQFARTWQKLVFTGKAQMPKKFNSDTELLEYLARNNDAIGYIDKANITSAVKIIKVGK